MAPRKVVAAHAIGSHSVYVLAIKDRPILGQRKTRVPLCTKLYIVAEAHLDELVSSRERGSRTVEWNLKIRDAV